jgi:GNAT superfamily N-acetyltransferase
MMTGPTTITTGGRERVPATASLYASAFRSDPVITYLLSTLPPPQRHAYLEEYFTRLATAAALNDAVFEEAEGFSSCSIIIPPGKSVDNPWTLIPAGLFSVLWRLGIKGCWRMLGEFEPATSAVRRKALGVNFQTNFYYLFFVATREDARGRGLSSALIKRLQERAAKEDLPVWLEATTEYSSRVYAKLGFERVETVVLGKGHADSDGTALKDGCGVPIYCMIWWPEKKV